MTENENKKDRNFLVHIISEICTYAVENGMEPNDTLKIVAENLLALLEISNFNRWKNNKKIGGIEE